MQSQLSLDIGPSDHFTALHGQHSESVCFATKGNGWRQETLPHDAAAFRASTILDDGLTPVSTYMSQAGYRGRRAVNNVSSLPALYVDLDYYNIPELADLDATELLSVILEKEPWLPVPTLLVDSGRGAYFVWLFDKPLSRDSLPQWQVVENYLVDALKSYGADPAARDAARVLRLAGSINTKSGETVFYRRLSATVSFSMMRGLVPEPKARPTVIIPNKPKAVRTNLRRLFTPYSLAHARMQDYSELARQRALADGGKMTDGRHRMVYFFAVASSWYCPTPSVLQAEVKEFCQEHFAEPEKYYNRSRFGAVVSRMIAEKAGATVREQIRYTLSNEYLINLLQITAEEQQDMSTIIGPEEKRLRGLAAKDKKRREAGKPTRSALKEASLIRAERARQLAADDVSIIAIARELEVKRSTVYRYLSGEG